MRLHRPRNTLTDANAGSSRHGETTAGARGLLAREDHATRRSPDLSWLMSESRKLGAMPRFDRRLFMLFAVLSLVLCLAACVLWVRGHQAPVRVAGFVLDDPRPGVRAGMYVWSAEGQAIVVWSEHLAKDGRATPVPDGSTADTLLSVRGPGLLGRMGFTQFGYTANRTGTQTWMWTAPMWACC